ncbi:hypothetical protein FHS76_003987 [Ochrobactrum daejeonense]|uniref:Peptidase S74 domain-containing protein n=1 Tax=Brucella daejeonensis TaxID=659015 RepID=A0A7W9B0Q2_9HYPH|nr:tail fiber domain-containing protein [Brucella daejeonensis]MBB5704072.1 hypothetical protein [Brucella daejeonensis]
MPAKPEHLTNDPKSVHSGQERHLETSTAAPKAKERERFCRLSPDRKGHPARVTPVDTTIKQKETRAQFANRLHALNLDTIMHLRPVSFRYKASYAEGKPGMNGLKRGFIAQEAEKVLPEVARKRKKI